MIKSSSQEKVVRVVAKHGRNGYNEDREEDAS
jgi:hypothetical protein